MKPLLDAKEPEKLGGLRKYLDEERLRRPFASHLIAFASMDWSDEETAAAEPAAARVDFMRYAAGHSDPRIAVLGAAGEAIIEDRRRRGSSGRAPSFDSPAR